MIPVSANHTHVRRLYEDARARQERTEAIQFLRVLIAAFAIFLTGAACVVAHFWR